MENQNPYRTMRSDDLAFAVVVLASYVMIFTSGALDLNQPGRLVLITALTLIYLSFGLLGERYISSNPAGLIKIIYFAVEIGLGGMILQLGRGAPWLLLLPVASQAVQMLPRAWGLLACLVIWVVQLLPPMLAGAWDQVFAGGAAYLAALVFVIVFTQLLTSEQTARKELAEANHKLREYAVKVEELATAQERNRLAREIHDGLGHYLTAINIQIKAAQSLLTQDPAQAGGALSNAQTLTQEALADVRRSISALRADPTTSKPLQETLAGLLAETRAAGVETQLEVEGAPRPLSPQVEFTLYRTAQEGLTNVRKHARAGRAGLLLAYRPGSVQLTVTDDGAGAQDTGGGFGITGLRERVALLNGSLHVETSPGQGFRLSVELPG